MKRLPLLVLPLGFFLMLGTACGKPTESRWPVFDRTQYGMTPEEVRKAEGLSEARFVLDNSEPDSGLTVYRAEQKAFGAEAEVVYLFDADDDLGLVSVQILFQEELSGSGKEAYDTLMGNTQGITVDQLTQKEQDIFLPVMTKHLNEGAKGVDNFTEENVQQMVMVRVYVNSDENRLTYDGSPAAWLAKLMRKE